MNQLAPARYADTREQNAALNLPASLEAEQAVLGCLLYDNETIHRIDGLRAEHFREPFHGRLFEAISQDIGKGRLAEPVGLAKRFEADPAFADLGGLDFLLDMYERAPATTQAAHFGHMITDAAQRRALIDLGETISQESRAADIEVGDLINRAEAGLLAMQATSRAMELMPAGAASARVLAYLDSPEEAVAGIRTGLAALDEELGPLLPGNLILFMGRPGMGKSAAAECVALNIAQQGYGVIQINGEMTEEEMAQRHLTDLCQARHGFKGPEYRNIRRRRIGQNERAMLQDAHNQLDRLPLTMIKRAGVRFSQLRSLARRQAAVWARDSIPLGALIVDHVGLVRTDANVRDRYEAQTIISNGMKELAEELGCPIIALNQMNRDNERREDKRPQLADLRDSGSWEQDADIVIGWFREAYYAQREPEPKTEVKIGEWLSAKASRTVEAIILKNRAGACSTVNLWGDVARNAIRTAAPDHGDLM